MADGTAGSVEARILVKSKSFQYFSLGCWTAITGLDRRLAGRRGVIACVAARVEV
jgi:hypothetical protein